MHVTVSLPLVSLMEIYFCHLTIPIYYRCNMYTSNNMLLQITK